MKRSGKVSFSILIVIVMCSLFAPFLSQYDPYEINLDSLREPPSLTHPLGTDNKGRDIFVRILYGGRISIGTAVTAALLSMIFGLVIGLCAGYFGGKIDAVLMSFVDLILSFPALLLAIAISIVFPSGIYTVIIAITAVGWASFARLVRGHVLTLSGANFIDAARSIGCSNMRILFVHLLPQCIPIMLVMMGVKMGGYILTEASLSFLGLSAQPPIATWGSMINAHRAYISSAPWMVFAPGFMIALTALCFNILGDVLQDKFDLKIGS